MRAKQNLTPKKADWIGGLITGLYFLWVVLTVVFVYAAAWLIQETLIIEGQEWPWWGWPLAVVPLGLWLVVPLGVLAKKWPHRHVRPVFAVWAAAAAYMLFLLPVRLVPANASQTGALLQIILTGLYAWGLRMALRRGWLPGEREWGSRSGSVLGVLVIVPSLMAGWLVWSSVGSLLDVLLNLGAGLMFGVVVGWLVEQVLLVPWGTSNDGVWRDILVGGFVLGPVLLMMGAALGFGGNALLLGTGLPAMGFLAIALSWLGRSTPRGSWAAVALLVGLAAAAPLVFVDPDETVLILNYDGGDILSWGFKATLFMAFAGLGWGLLLLLLNKYLPRWQHRRLFGAAAAVLWLGAAGIYGFVGHPGFYGERMLVILKDQADLTPAAAIEDYGQRRVFVYQTLVAHAVNTQEELRETLDRFGVGYTPYYLSNALAVEANPFVRMWLVRHPAVDRVLDSPELRPLPEMPAPARGIASPPGAPQWNLTMIGAAQVWADFGITGEGVVIGQSDSGVEWTHPELQAAYRGVNGDHNYNWFDPWNGSQEPQDFGGHGTHTLGSIVGATVGVAPGAVWYGCVNLARNLANPALYLDCLQFMLAPWPLDGDPFRDGDPLRGADVLNNSWGCPEIEGCDPGALVDAVRALRAAGVFVVASAGNDGPACESLNAPIALYDEVFTVGAIDSVGGLASFSSRGPVLVDGSGRVKPDIIAPGVEVLSAFPGGTYEYNSGTSMAGPHLVGVVALMWSANPALRGDVDQTEQILIETATPYNFSRFNTPTCSDGAGWPNSAAGYGLVDAYAAVDAALGAAP